MTIDEAMNISYRGNIIQSFPEFEKWIYEEAMVYLIRETNDSKYMVDLGCYYYKNEYFNLALKYFEKAAEYDNKRAYEYLGHLWYEGYHGTVNYEKAFNYYSLGVHRGNVNCEYKIADMYRYGYFVEKDENKYEQIIRNLYNKVRDGILKVPEIYVRISELEKREGNDQRAKELLYSARKQLERRMSVDWCFDDFRKMNGIIDEIYKIEQFRPNQFKLYDLYYVLRKPVKVSFVCNKSKYFIQSLLNEKGKYTLLYEDGIYCSIDDFLKKAECPYGKMITWFDALDDFKVEE